MRINVAGAGAGKTTCMASRVAECIVPAGQVIFCIAFTNAAIENIRKHVCEIYGCIPGNIRISTIHSFFYQEFIQPYYYLLYGKHYLGISVIELPQQDKYRFYQISELDKEGYIHQTKIPEKAKWVVDKKSKDTADVKGLRKRILDHFSEYCEKIFVDEAQDIDKDMKAVLEALDRQGVSVELFGDPKQDIKGHGCYQEMIANNRDIHYMKICHRCPQKHLNLSNMLAKDEEQQSADTHNKEGSINFYYETAISDLEEFITPERFGLIYIHQLNDRFETHDRADINLRCETLYREVLDALGSNKALMKSTLEMNRIAYFVAEQMLQEYSDSFNASMVVTKWINTGTFCYNPKSYAKMCEILDKPDITSTAKIQVKSIESIKGLEDDNCLFILTPAIAPYLFGDKSEDNKMKHLLYVALTRSLDNLSILVSKEVEERYTVSFIDAFFHAFI